MAYFIIAAAVLVLDQLTKWLVVQYMEIGQTVPIIEDLFYLTSHRNAGAAFGILQNQRLFFIVVTSVVVVFLVYYLVKLKNQKRLLSFSLALILGGALGNLIDRLFLGAVVDFFDVKIPLGLFTYDFPIFNIADSALVIGVGLMLIDTLRDGRRESS